jgi:prolyl-tRNA editing enzyme YbaK/EbsC (Cys-tRNA(Pro) deacylase)
LNAQRRIQLQLNTQHLRQFIADHHINAEIVQLSVDTPTVAAAAAAVGVHPQQIIKSVLFLADKQPVLVVANGLTRIDRKRLADNLQVARRRVKIASGAEVLAVTGFPAGAVPPFGHKEFIRTVLETAVLTQSTVYGGGGEIRALMRLPVVELRRIVGDEVANLAE